jgi:hypothetical protein
MQQRERGATLFPLQVAPAQAFSVYVDFLLPFEAKTAVFRRKRTETILLCRVGKFAGRVAPFP